MVAQLNLLIVRIVNPDSERHINLDLNYAYPRDYLERCKIICIRQSLRLPSIEKMPWLANNHFDRYSVPDRTLEKL